MTDTTDTTVQQGQIIAESLGIAISAIRMDGGTQQRVRMDEAAIAEYAQAIAEGAQFPPVSVIWEAASETFWLVDGYHRVEAHRRAGRQSIAAQVRAGTRRDAVLASVAANATNGIRRTRDDVRNAIVTMLKDPEWSSWSDRAIAQAVGCHHNTVAAVRAKLAQTGEIIQSDTRVDARGRTMDISGLQSREAAPAPAKLAGTILDEVHARRVAVWADYSRLVARLGHDVPALSQASRALNKVWPAINIGDAAGAMAALDAAEHHLGEADQPADLTAMIDDMLARMAALRADPRIAAKGLAPVLDTIAAGMRGAHELSHDRHAYELRLRSIISSIAGLESQLLISEMASAPDDDPRSAWLDQIVGDDDDEDAEPQQADDDDAKRRDALQQEQARYDDLSQRFERLRPAWSNWGNLEAMRTAARRLAAAKRHLEANEPYDVRQNLDVAEHYIADREDYVARDNQDAPAKCFISNVASMIRLAETNKSILSRYGHKIADAADLGSHMDDLMIILAEAAKRLEANS